jgi:hypothetical protein
MHISLSFQIACDHKAKLNVWRSPSLFERHFDSFRDSAHPKLLWDFIRFIKREQLDVNRSL